MKKFVPVLLIILVFASSAWATIYKWTDDRGVLNFTDDPDKVPPAYRGEVEKFSIPAKEASTPFQTPLPKTVPSAATAKAGEQAPSIAQTLIREGDFAIELAAALRIGSVADEVEAESRLALAGIAPRNGWIADYPVTPDILGELQNSVREAADSGRLAMSKAEALRAFEDLTTREALPPGSDHEARNAEGEPSRDYVEHSNPEVINNYYYNEGPPVVTYYPPPPEYRYLYAWVPYPFWCSRLHFPGFFILHDFHRTIVVNKRGAKITNHVIDPGTKRFFSIDPVTRGRRELRHNAMDVSGRRGFPSPDAERSASSILLRSPDRAKTGISQRTERRRAVRRQIPVRSSSTSESRGAPGGPLTGSPWMGERQREAGPKSMGGRGGSLRQFSGAGSGKEGSSGGGARGPRQK